MQCNAVDAVGNFFIQMSMSFAWLWKGSYPFVVDQPPIFLAKDGKHVPVTCRHLMHCGKRCFATCLVMLLLLALVWPQCVSKAAEVPSLHVAQYVWFQRMMGATTVEHCYSLARQNAMHTSMLQHGAAMQWATKRLCPCCLVPGAQYLLSAEQGLRFELSGMCV